jgi:hypothetical protein
MGPVGSRVGVLLSSLFRGRSPTLGFTRLERHLARCRAPHGSGGDLTVIASVRGGTGKPLHLPWGKVLPRGSVAYRVWERAHQSPQRPCTDEAVEYWVSLGRLGRRRVEAVTNPLSWATPESVLCLLHELPKR